MFAYLPGYPRPPNTYSHYPINHLIYIQATCKSGCWAEKLSSNLGVSQGQVPMKWLFVQVRSHHKGTKISPWPSMVLGQEPFHQLVCMWQLQRHHLCSVPEAEEAEPIFFDKLNRQSKPQ